MSAETIDQAIADPLLLGAALGDLDSWATWRTVFRAAYGLALSEDELDLLEQLAGPNRSPPTDRVDELWVLAGRRSGKSRAAALIASFVGMQDHSAKLAPGETGFIVVMSPTKDQSKVIHGYVKAFFASSPVLRQMVISHNTEEIVLDNGVTIMVTPNSFRTVRSRTLLAAIFDETAFWRDETSANPDLEIYRATTPALITTGGMLIGISSPYRKVGLIHQKWKNHFNRDGSVLVIRAPTTTLNSTIDGAKIAAEYEADPEAAASEWGGEFRTDISALLDDATIDAAIDHDRPLQLPPNRDKEYVAFVDSSAGRHDSFTMCVGFREGRHFTAAAVLGRKPPFDPNAVAAEFAALAKSYGVGHVTGDHFSGEWVVAAFSAAGMAYKPAPVAKSALYVEMVPAFMRGSITIPDLPILIRELRQLERRVHRSGKDSVDHPSNGGTDDYANVLAGALYMAANEAEVPTMMVGKYSSGGCNSVSFGHGLDIPEAVPGSITFDVMNDEIRSSNFDRETDPFRNAAIDKIRSQT